MKSIRSLIMIAVCMTVFTCMATTTATTEHKQTTELVKELTFQANAVSVVNDYQIVSVQADAATDFVGASAPFVANENLLITLSPHSADVGWIGNHKGQAFIKNYRQKRNQKYQYTSDRIVYNDVIRCRNTC